MELGALVAIYHGRPFGRSDILSLWLPGLLGILAPSAYGYWRASYAYASFGPVAAETWSWPWFLLSGLASILFILLLLYRLYLARRFVAVHKNGLRLHIPFRPTLTLAWQQISGVSIAIWREDFFSFTLRKRHRTTLYLTGGKRLQLGDDLQNLPELTSRIKANLYPRLLSKMRTRFQAGEWLSFGDLSIQCNAMRFQGKQVPWDEIERLAVQDGFLMVESKDHGFRRIPAARIPNIEILIQLIQQGVNVYP